MTMWSHRFCVGALSLMTSDFRFATTCSHSFVRWPLSNRCSFSSPGPVTTSVRLCLVIAVFPIQVRFSLAVYSILHQALVPDEVCFVSCVVGSKIAEKVARKNGRSRVSDIFHYFSYDRDELAEPVLRYLFHCCFIASVARLFVCLPSM